MRRARIKAKKSVGRTPRAKVITKKAPKKRTPKKLHLRRSKKIMAARTARRKTSSMRKAASSTKKTAGRAPKSFLHKMLTAEGWKRLMMGKSRKK